MGRGHEEGVGELMPSEDKIPTSTSAWYTALEYSRVGSRQDGILLRTRVRIPRITRTSSSVSFYSNSVWFKDKKQLGVRQNA